MSTHRQHLLTVVFLASVLSFIVVVKQVQEASFAASATAREAARTQATVQKKMQILRMGTGLKGAAGTASESNLEPSLSEQKAALEKQIQWLTNKVTALQAQVKSEKSKIRNGNTGVSAVKVQTTVDALMKQINQYNEQLGAAKASLDAIK